MKRYKLIAASAAFLGLALLRTAFPSVSEEMRSRVQSAMTGGADVAEAFHELGSRLSLNSQAVSTPDFLQASGEAIPRPAPLQVSYRVEEGSDAGEFLELAPVETPPPAVAAFLERQSAFSDYALPENVNYAYLSLPFDYTVPVAGRGSSGFGYRLHPILNVVRFHYGTDIAASAGESIAAFADGTVAFAGSDESFGKHLKIDHGNGWVSHYCHCSSLCVKEGQTVRRGEVVAFVGATGLATGPHLHFELSRDGVFVNPEYYINA